MEKARRGLLKQVNDEIFHRRCLGNERLMTTLSRKRCQPRGLTPGILPTEGGGGLVLSDPRFKEILFFVEVDGFTHPGEGVFRFILGFETDPF